jgi:mono/diheme cytochrome c family protein
MRLLALIGALAIIGAIAIGGYLFGGFYSVAATQPENELVASALEQIRMASIARHGEQRATVALEDPAVVQAGARAYAARGCVSCHGAPGITWAKFSEAMRPYPPDLKDVVKAREPGELFFVIKNGIKMTGMPGFALIGADDREIWSIVAFIRRMPNVSEADFKAWSESGEAGASQ